MFYRTIWISASTTTPSKRKIKALKGNMDKRSRNFYMIYWKPNKISQKYFINQLILCTNAGTSTSTSLHNSALLYD